MSEHRHNKVDLAIEQLEIALSLFLKKQSYVSALTLSGAAEEILGMAVKTQGIENSLQESYRVYCSPEFSWLNPPKTWTDYTTRGKNRVRNAIKHLSNADDLSFDADIKDEALWMIVRATDNYSRLGFTPTELIHQFDEWFYENVVDI